MKKIWFSLSIILLIAAGCNSSSTTQQAETTPTPTQQPVVQNSTPTPTPTPTSASINSSVSTYTDSIWGFSFQYPKNYVASNQNVKKTAKFGTVTLVTVRDPKDKSVEFGPELDVNVIQQPYAADGKIYTDVYSFATAYLKLSPYNTDAKTNVNGYDAFRVDKSLGTDGPVQGGQEFYIMKDRLIYDINYSSQNSKDYSIFQNIVNSFKFTNFIK